MADRRLAVPEAAAAAAARRLARHAFRFPPVVRARRLGCYLAWRGELDLAPLIREAWARRRQVFLPVLAGQNLRFAPFTPTTPLRPNRYGIPEPDVDRQQWIPASGLDAVLAPLLAFDARGHRLGMGGGYYDRTFRFRAGRSAWRRPWLIGTAYEFQRVAQLPDDPWDITLDAVITDAGSARTPVG